MWVEKLRKRNKLDTCCCKHTVQCQNVVMRSQYATLSSVRPSVYFRMYGRFTVLIVHDVDALFQHVDNSRTLLRPAAGPAPRSSATGCYDAERSRPGLLQSCRRRHSSRWSVMHSFSSVLFCPSEKRLSELPVDSLASL